MLNNLHKASCNAKGSETTLMMHARAAQYIYSLKEVYRIKKNTNESLSEINITCFCDLHIIS